MDTWSINEYFNSSFQIRFSLGKKSTLKFPVRAFFHFFKNNSVREQNFKSGKYSEFNILSI